MRRKQRISRDRLNLLEEVLAGYKKEPVGEDAVTACEWKSFALSLLDRNHALYQKNCDLQETYHDAFREARSAVDMVKFAFNGISKSTQKKSKKLECQA
jgi:hypothetical protein